MSRKTAREIANAIAKHIKLDDGDILLMKRNPNDIGENLEVFNALRNAFGLTGRKRCVIMIVDDFNDVTTVSEAEMATYGWCKCGDIWNDDDEEE